MCRRRRSSTFSWRCRSSAASRRRASSTSAASASPRRSAASRSGSARSSLASSPATRPVFVVTGPSGAGKGTLISLVLPRFTILRSAVSATTRGRRAGERNGIEYWFLSDDEFTRRVDDGGFLEWVEYVGNRYGTLRSEIDRIRAEGGA